MTANPQVVIRLLTLKCGSSLDAVPSREEMKLAERIASIQQDFELRQLEIDEVEKLEVVKEEDQEFQPEEDCAGVTTQPVKALSGFREDRSFRRKGFDYTRIVILYKFENGGSGVYRDSRLLGLQRSTTGQEL